MTTRPRILIETVIPLPEINDASAYDKMPGIGPHPKGIHHWWARLPLVIPQGWFAANALSALPTAEETEPLGVREDSPVYGAKLRGGGPEDTTVSELLAMEEVFAYERAIGNEPRDVSDQNVGYDIESRNPETGQLRFIEVKGRAKGAPFITLTRNEILAAPNKPESWWLVIVLIEDGKAEKPVYLKEPFREGIPFSAATLNVKLSDLMP